jgi:hypothetical protein
MGMKRTDIKQLVRECLNEVITDQHFENLSDGISRSTEIGKNWMLASRSLETVYNEIRDFEGLYRTAIMKSGQKPANIAYSLQKLEQVVALLNEVKPTISTMSQIQSSDR